MWNTAMHSTATITDERPAVRLSQANAPVLRYAITTADYAHEVSRRIASERKMADYERFMALVIATWPRTSADVVPVAAVMADDRPRPDTATRLISRIAGLSGDAASSVRSALTTSPLFAEFRINAERIDGLPLTQCVRLLRWLATPVMDEYGTYRSRYEQLMGYWLTLAQMLDREA
jgi:hypothetical protein